MTDRLTTLSTTIITADPSQVERDMAVASDPITTDSNNVETTEVIPNIGAATVTGEHMFKSTDESASSLPPLKDMNKVDAEHGDDDTVSGAYMNPDRESPTTEVATHEDAGQESTEADSFTGAQEYTQTKQDIDVKEEGVVTEDMDVDTGVAVGPDDPIWIDEDEYDGPPLQQPETFQGRSTKTGYVYDVRMKHHNNVHGDDDHPEDPRRIWRIFDALNTAQCTDRMIKIPTREATAEELSLVHTENHIENITKTAGMNKDDLFAAANNYNSIYLNNSSAFCARLSCGSLIELCRAVALGQVLNGLAIIRPPGHHAEPDEAGGFCLFNNVAIAARYLQKCHGLQKIFILDWDVHHGNGTQSAFYDDPDVVYCSIHRFDHGTFYPGDPIAGAHTAIGEGKGRGRTINIPWNSSGMGDSEYLYAFHKVIIPIIYEFAPDFVLVSAGFDAAEGDHIGQMLVTPAAYGHMTHMLKSLAGGKIILALEGGYNLDSIAVSGLACAKALLNDPIKPLDPIVPNALCVQTIHEVIEVQSPYWRSLPQAYTAPVNDPIESHLIIGVDKILSSYRQSYLQEKHDMIRVPKLESDHMSDFLDNVLCTQRTFGTKPLYIFIHDLSEEISIRTLGTSSTVRTDKSIMVDTVSQYVDYIIDSGNELIDIVVPYQPTTEDERTALKEKLTGLLAEIWDNYVSTTGYTGRKIVLLAAGFGCHSMTAFINERQKEVVKYVSCVTLVPGDDILLPMVTKKMGPWYFDNSFVILADDHPYWEKAPKANNRTGTLIRSEHSSCRFSELLNRLRTSIFEVINNRLESLPPAPEIDSDEDFKDSDSSVLDTGETALTGNSSNGHIRATDETILQVKKEEPEPGPQSPRSPVQPVKMEEPGPLPRALSPPQTRSYPSSPVLNGLSTPRPISHPLVDRHSVLGQPRAQPYPTPNGRSINGNGSLGTSSPKMMSSHPRSSTPRLRTPEPKMTGELFESKSQSTITSHPQYHSQQPSHAIVEHQLREHHLRQQQQGKEAGDHHLPPQMRPTSGNGRQDSGHPYSHQGSPGNDKRVLSRPISGTGAGGVGGPGEYYSSQSTASKSVAGSPSMMAHPHPSYPPSSSSASMGLNSGGNSPRPSHSSKTTMSHQPVHHPTPIPGPSGGNGGPGYGTQSNSPGNYRSGGRHSPIPPPGSSPAPPPFESMHRHRASYSSHGPPPPPPSNGQQHSGPPGSVGFRHHQGWSGQQQHQAPYSQPSMAPSSRSKRPEQESDPYVSQFSQSQQPPPRHHPSPHHHQDMERQRMIEAERLERQRWDIDQQARQHKVQPQQHQRTIDHGYEIHGQLGQHGHPSHQQQHQQQHLHHRHPSQSYSNPHSHSPHQPPPHHPSHQQQHHSGHYESMHDRGRAPPMMMKQSHHLQHPHPN